MKSALALLALTTAFGTSLFGALSAAPITEPLTAPQNVSWVASSGGGPAQLILASSDEDDEDDEDDDDDEDEDDDDDDDGMGGMRCLPGQNGCNPGTNPAPAGNAAPPANGLFAPGAKPAVQMN